MLHMPIARMELPKIIMAADLREKPVDKISFLPIYMKLVTYYRT